MLACRICGGAVALDQVHIKWHIGNNDWNDFECPWDGSIVQETTANDDGGVTKWSCQHVYMWKAGENNG
jgi:hypothetical protein